VSDDVRRKREARAAFLRRLYVASEEEASEYLDAFEVAGEMGLSRQDAERFTRYFEDQGFVRKAPGPGLTLRITAQGIDHVEREAEG
jgi:hypothetical protein